MEGCARGCLPRLTPEFRNTSLQCGWILHGQRNLRLLTGITSVPLLRDDGSMFITEGYDDITGLWLENMPDPI